MQKRQEVILNSRGEPVQGVSVRVVTFPVTVDATIYSDDGITTTTNPLTTDANGRYSYYAADGRYSEQLSGAGITPLTITDILLQDAVAATIPESLFHNLSLQCSVAANALTISIKTTAGTNPSSASPVRIVFRNSTPGTGDHTSLSVTSATSLTVTNGSTLGITFTFRLWIVAFNDGGTVRLGIINCVSFSQVGNDIRTVIFPLSAFGIASSTAEGGAGAADSALTFYTGTAVTSKPYTVLGYATWETVPSVIGQWDTVPTRLQIFGPHTPLPGRMIQIRRHTTGVVGTGTTVLPSDDTIPQNNEGTEVFSADLTPSSAANVAVVRAFINVSASTAGTITSALFNSKDGAPANTATANIGESAGRMFGQYLEWMSLIGQHTPPLTVSVRSGLSVAGTITVNGVATVRLYGGSFLSYLEIRELMG